jgi:hypothetical protein
MKRSKNTSEMVLIPWGTKAMKIWIYFKLGGREIKGLS